MTIHSSAISPYQVLQRDFSTQGVNVVLKNGKIKKYAIGGPYTIDNVCNVMVGDVWVLAGQSNMRGNGFFRDPWSNETVEQLIYDSTIHLFGMKESWAIAKDPIPAISQSRRHVDFVLPDPTVTDPSLSQIRGGSLALPFAQRYQKLMQLQLGVKHLPIGLIAAAHGGVSLDQWSPTLLRDTPQWQNNSLYGAMLGRINSSTSGSNKVAGILWYQGESDVANATAAQTYQTRMSNWISNARNDLGNKNLSVVQVQLARELSYADNDSGWSLVRAAQASLVNKNIGAVSSIDCPLDDRIHLSLKAAQTAMNNEAYLASPQIIPESIVYERIKVSTHYDTYALKLSFKYLNNQGNSWADVDLPQGFTLRDVDENDLDLIYRIKFYEGNQVVRLLLTDTAAKLPNGTTVYLYYGYGKNPICNIVSTNGMGLLAFGPIPFTFNTQ